jgi:hypothetical protein
MLPLKLAKDADLATGELVALERALLGEEGAHVADESSGDRGRKGSGMRIV